MNKWAIALLLAPLSLQAGPFQIKNRRYPPGPVLRRGVDQIFGDIEAQVNDMLPRLSSRGGRYMDSMSQASVAAGKGLGNYHGPMPSWAVGFGAGLGASLGPERGLFQALSSGQYEKLSGLGAQSGIVGGVNLKFLGPWTKVPFPWERGKLWAHAMSFKARKGHVSLSDTSFGAHLQFQAIEGDAGPAPFSGVRWWGLGTSLGYEGNSSQITLARPITVTQHRSLEGHTLTGSFDGVANFGGTIKTHSVGLEVATGGDFFFFLSLYGGLGVGINSGEGQVRSSLSEGEVTVGAQGVEEKGQGEAQLDFGSAGGPKGLLARAFVGAQLNFWGVKVTAQVNKFFGEDLYGIQAGVLFVR